MVQTGQCQIKNSSYLFVGCLCRLGDRYAMRRLTTVDYVFVVSFRLQETRKWWRRRGRCAVCRSRKTCWWSTRSFRCLRQVTAIELLLENLNTLIKLGIRLNETLRLLVNRNSEDLHRSVYPILAGARGPAPAPGFKLGGGRGHGPTAQTFDEFLVYFKPFFAISRQYFLFKRRA